jgi:hypothetical protein
MFCRLSSAEQDVEKNIMDNLSNSSQQKKVPLDKNHLEIFTKENIYLR